jgi:glucose-1-phosphate adenylyltransferase
MKDVLAVILGGGRGAGLYPLTRHRSEPAVPLGGKYRLIDVPISNCLNAGLNQVYVLTQFLSVSLHRHIAATYKVDPFNRGFVEVLAAQQTNESADWYQGTADALRQNLRYLTSHGADLVLVLSSDQIYRMDFANLVHRHRESGAPVTMAVTPVTRERTGTLGVVQANEQDVIRLLVEKPQTAGELQRLRMPASWLQARGVAALGREHLANMGIYLFNSSSLVNLLEAHPAAIDLVRDLLVPSLATHGIRVKLFDGYWEDVGTIRAYHQANLALAGDQPPFDFHIPEGVIFTRMRYLPPSRILASRVAHSLIADGCEVQAGTCLERSVIGIRSRIGRDVTLRDTVMNGADDLETPIQLEENRRLQRPGIGIGDGCVIERAILDKGCRIGRDVRILNRGGVTNEDGPHHVIREGIVVIPDGTTVPDGTVI